MDTNTPHTVELLDGRITVTRISKDELHESANIEIATGGWRFTDTERTDLGTLSVDFPFTAEMAEEVGPDVWLSMAVSIFERKRADAGLPPGDYGI